MVGEKGICDGADARLSAALQELLMLSSLKVES